MNKKVFDNAEVLAFVVVALLAGCIFGYKQGHDVGELSGERKAGYNAVKAYNYIDVLEDNMPANIFDDVISETDAYQSYYK